MDKKFSSIHADISTFGVTTEINCPVGGAQMVLAGYIVRDTWNNLDSEGKALFKELLEIITEEDAQGAQIVLTSAAMAVVKKSHQGEKAGDFRGC